MRWNQRGANRDASLRRARAIVRPHLEGLETRTMLSVAVPRPAALVATGAAAAPSTSAQDNATYIAGLVGAERLLSSRENALAQRLTAELNAGVPRSQVVAELLRSGPARALQVQTTYQRVLHRLPNAAELRAGVERVHRAGDERALVVALVGTPEYRRVRGSGLRAGIIDALYQDILQRDPTAAEQSAGVIRLARGGTVAALARRLLDSSEARLLLLEGARGVLGSQAPAATIQDLRDIVRPDGLVRVTARALASDSVYQQLVHPAVPPPTSTPSSGSTAMPGFPIPPGFDLNSRVTPLNVSEHFVFESLSGLSAGTDDIPWFATPVGLLTYNLQTGVRATQYSTKAALSVAAIDANEAYGVVTDSSGNSVIHLVGGVATTLPALPGGASPSKVAASPDGTLWILANGGTIFAFDAAQNTWTSIATQGYTITQISVGSASNIWAVTSGGVGLQYTPANGFQTDSFLTSKVNAVAATFDGSVWANAAGFTFMKPSFGDWKITPKQPGTGFSCDDFAAGSMNRAYQGGFSTSNNQTNGQLLMISIGVVDRQAVPFPTYTGSDQDAYLALSQAALITNPAGVRSIYDSPGEDWGGLQSRIANAIRPSNIPVDSWNRVQNDLTTELLEVGTVYGRLQLIQDLMTRIQLVNDGAISAAASVVGLSQPYGSDRDTVIRLVLEGIFEAVASAISSTGIPPAGAVVAAMLASGFSSAISAYESSNPPDSQGAVAIEYSNLQSQLDTLFLQSIAQINSDISEIVTDQGKLSTVALAILNNAWPYINQTSTQIAAATTDAFNEYFYQSLMSVKWQVIRSRYGDYIKYPIDQILKLPSYAYYQVPLGYELGMPIEEVYIVNELGGTTDLNSVTLGQIPIQQLFTNLQALPGTEFNDFWVGNGNWSLIKRVKGTLG